MTAIAMGAWLSQIAGGAGRVGDQRPKVPPNKQTQAFSRGNVNDEQGIRAAYRSHLVLRRRQKIQALETRFMTEGLCWPAMRGDDLDVGQEHEHGA